MLRWPVVNLEPTEDFTYRKSVQMNWFFLCLGRPWICISHLTFRTEAVRQTKYNCFSFICMPLNTVRGEGCVSEKKSANLYKAVLYTHPMLNGVYFVTGICQSWIPHHPQWTIRLMITAAVSHFVSLSAKGLWDGLNDSSPTNDPCGCEHATWWNVCGFESWKLQTRHSL